MELVLVDQKIGHERRNLRQIESGNLKEWILQEFLEHEDIQSR